MYIKLSSSQRLTVSFGFGTSFFNIRRCLPILMFSITTYPFPSNQAHRLVRKHDVFNLETDPLLWEFELAEVAVRAPDVMREHATQHMHHVGAMGRPSPKGRGMHAFYQCKQARLFKMMIVRFRSIDPRKSPKKIPDSTTHNILETHHEKWLNFFII